ncbi:MAG: 2-oxo acid dehydrogenase subunit E2 [Vicinamibacterales bacterium]
MTEFKLPNLGDGVTAGDVLRVLVKVGDTLGVDQSVVELETDKATLEVPSTVAGRVTDVKVKAGDKVKPGQVVLVVDAAGGGAATGTAAAAPAAAGPGEADSPTDRPAVMAVGPGSADDPTDRPTAMASGPGESDDPTDRPLASLSAGPGESDDPTDRPNVLAFSASRGLPTTAQAPAPAAPSVRRLARELGVDLHQVPGSGPGGRIGIEDVKAFTKQVMASLGGGGQRAVATVAGPAAALPDFSKWGAVERKPMSGIRRKTAEHLSHAWNTIPHVTQFDKADITALEQVRKQYRAEVERAGGNLTVTAIAAKVVAGALKAFPQFNASVDAAGEAIVYKNYVHVGIAVDTENGLLVPVIRNVDQKNLIQISVEIQQLADKAKARKLSIDDMSGGSMSISNLGGIGGTAFTPIVNWPEVAILGISRGAQEPRWTGNGFEPRLMLPLSLSYDHRLIDGADAIRFLRWVVEALENPFALALRG